MSTREESLRELIAAAMHCFSHEFTPELALERWEALKKAGQSSVDVESHLRGADRVIAMMVWFHGNKPIAEALRSEGRDTAERLATAKAEEERRQAERIGKKP